MKVMCINDTPLPGVILGNNWPLKVGEVYKVISTKIIGGKLYYKIHVDPEYHYLHIHFAVISCIDETELIKEREESYA